MIIVAALLWLMLHEASSFLHRFGISSYPLSLRMSGAVDLSLEPSASDGIETVITYLNSEGTKSLRNQLVTGDMKLCDELADANFWSGGSAVVEHSECKGISENGIQFDVSVKFRGKQDLQVRQAFAPFPRPVLNEDELKIVLLEMAYSTSNKRKKMSKDSAQIAALPFGQDATLPNDFKFNNVPHASWVRSYIYNQVTTAICRAVNDDTIPNKSRMQLKINFPEVNPAFDTYRIGTLLEMVREAVLALTEQGGKRVRICVQQSLGEGIFTGTPLALSAMRPMLERMDWGGLLSDEEKFQQGDDKHPRPEALIRFGTVGSDQIRDDDDILLVIAPQNIINGVIIHKLDEMCIKAAGRPVILINPQLHDRPSSNNKMQIRGREERRKIQDSFIDIYALRLLYPSTGGYMYPIGGVVAKKDYRAPWIVYSIQDEGGVEKFQIEGAFPPHTPPTPDQISSFLV